VPAGLGNGRDQKVAQFLSDHIEPALKAISKYASQASDPKERAVLTNLVGRAIKVTDDPLRLACLKAFQEMKDPSAWTWFAFLVIQPDNKKGGPMLDAAMYPSAALAEWDRGRWQVESNLKNLKTTMKMDVLHCTTVAGVSKELLMFVLT
jgi:hypothetical protein